MWWSCEEGGIVWWSCEEGVVVLSGGCGGRVWWSCEEGVVGGCGGPVRRVGLCGGPVRRVWWSCTEGVVGWCGGPVRRVWWSCVEGAEVLFGGCAGCVVSCIQEPTGTTPVQGPRGKQTTMWQNAKRHLASMPRKNNNRSSLLPFNTLVAFDM